MLFNIFFYVVISGNYKVNILNFGSKYLVLSELKFRLYEK